MKGCAAGIAGAFLIVVVVILMSGAPDVGLETPAAGVSSIVALPDGGFLYADRVRGLVREVDAEGDLAISPVATLDVSSEGQRGLLGIARDPAGAVFASWTDPDHVLRVARVALGSRQEVWRGPMTADVGNGGRIDFAPDGRLVIGIGDMRRPDLVDDPGAPNGKLLALDPSGPPGQRPDVLASGFNNPFAFDVLADGTIWIADNEPGDDTERLIRMAPGGDVEVVAGLPPDTAPSGIAVTPTSIYVCGYVSGSLLRFEPDPSGDPPETVADDCAYAVAQLTDGDVVYATPDAILELR